MKILIVTPEAHPFFKTGGLGDVAGSLARALARRGHDVRLALPHYRFLDTQGFDIRPLLPEIMVEIDGRWIAGAVDLAPGAAPAYLIRCDRYFDRAAAYGEVVGGHWFDYPDNLERFAFFCMAAMWTLKALDWRPDVIHANDWQTALIPAILKTHRIIATDPFYAGIRTVFAIHNLAFQARAPWSMAPNIGLGPEIQGAEGLAFDGGLNLMKGGIAFSDHITTVSPRYAQEIQTAELGCGLEGELRARASRLTGILNGIDCDEWNPATDPHLPAAYSADDLRGKALCKAALQRQAGFPADATIPLVGMVSRLSTQKGFELVDAILAPMLQDGAQLVVLGAGEPRYHRMLERMARRHPGRVSVRLTFDNGYAHLIEAGADLFLMPSYYEPCGLNQMFSMRYGTPPVVRATGGLADSVTDCTPETMRAGRATGFVFGPYDPDALWEALSRAFSLYRHSPNDWRRLMRNGMARDFSWDRVAGQYEDLYRRIVTPAESHAAAMDAPIASAR